MVKGLHKLFRAVVNEIMPVFPILGEPGSEVSCFNIEPKKIAEVTRLSEDIKKSYLKANFNKIKNLINNQTFIVQYPENGEPVTPCMDFNKVQIKSGGSFEKLKLRIVVRADL